MTEKGFSKHKADITEYNQNQDSILDESILLNIDIFSSEYEDEDEEQEEIVNEKKAVKHDVVTSEHAENNSVDQINNDLILSFEEEEFNFDIDQSFKETEINMHKLIIDDDTPKPKPKSKYKKSTQIKKTRNNINVITQEDIFNKKQVKINQPKQNPIKESNIKVKSVNDFMMQIDINKGFHFDIKEVDNLMNKNMCNYKNKMLRDSLKIEGV